MPSTRLLFSLAALALLATACRRQPDSGPLVASACGYELHRSDLAGLVPPGISADDSVAIVTNYVDQWVRQTVLLAKAEKNISDNFAPQLKEYKNSLLIHAYEQQIVNQLLDTVVTEEQISSYYAEHSGDFRLRSAIAKAVYVVAPEKSPLLPRLKSLVTKARFGDEEVVELEELASRHGLAGYFDMDTWLPFYNLQRAVPIATYNENLFLKQNRSIVITDDQHQTFFVRILDYKVSDDISPLEMQRDNIRALILNHRKVEILARLQNDLLAEAEQSNNVKRYI